MATAAELDAPRSVRGRRHARRETLGVILAALVPGEGQEIDPVDSAACYAAARAWAARLAELAGSMPGRRRLRLRAGAWVRDTRHDSGIITR